MRWLYRVQQRLALTRQEATAILTLALLLLIGLVARYVQQQPAPLPETTRAAYARADSLLAAGAAPAPAEEEAEAAATIEAPREAAAPTAAPVREGRFDLNTATAAQLETLPRIGPVLAQRVLDYRRAHGPFRSVDELQNVRGIGEKTVAGVAPHVFVAAPEGMP